MAIKWIMFCAWLAFTCQVKDGSPCFGIIPVMSRLYSIDGTDVSTMTKSQGVDLVKGCGAVRRL